MKIEIYGLVCPIENRVRYVGKSKNAEKRFYQHLYRSRNDKHFDNTHLHRWLKKIQRENLKPVLRILEVCDTETWIEREKHWIAFYGLETLCNMNEGGFQPPDATGRVLSEETKKQLSKQRKGKKLWTDGKVHPMKGKTHPSKGKSIHTEESRKKLSEAKLKNNPMRGKHLSDEHKKAISDFASKKVVEIDSVGNVIKEFSSIKNAQDFYGLYAGSVTRVCNGEYKQVKGHRFQYA